MSIYAIGDVQGCYSELRHLLDKIKFDPASDMVWFTGDLINRGPNNVEVLRFVRSLGERAVSVLGNHEIYTLVIVFGEYSMDDNDTLDDLISADDCEELCHWIRQLPLLHKENSHLLVHAGIPHTWTEKQAFSFANEVENVLRGEAYRELLRHLFDRETDCWSTELRGVERYRMLLDYLTRMRYIGKYGNLDFKNKHFLPVPPTGFQAWFDYPTRLKNDVIFGHWASLNGITNNEQFHSLDTGCVWGRTLTAMNLSDHSRVAVPKMRK